MKRRRARVLVRLFVTLFLLGIVLAVGFFVFHTNSNAETRDSHLFIP